MAQQHPRYKAFETNEKPRKEGGGLLIIRNMLILGAICYGGWYLIPASDKAELLEKIQSTSLPAPAANPAATPAPDAAAAPDQQATAAPAQQGGLMAMIMGLFGSSGKTVVGPIDIRAFPIAYNNWQRTDYLDPKTAPQAMRRMDRLLKTGTVSLLSDDEIRARTAAIYRAGRQELLIFVEAGDPPPPVPVAAAPANAQIVAKAEPGTPVVLQTPDAVATVLTPAQTDAIPAETPAVTEATLVLEQNTAAPAPAPEAPPPLPTVTIEGLTFTNHASARKGVIDLRAKLDSNRAIYVRGRTSMAVVEEFLSRTKLARMGLSN